MQLIALRVALPFLPVMWICGPPLTCVDPWDAFPDTGDSVIVFLAIVSLCIGAACCLACLVLLLIMTAAKNERIAFPQFLSHTITQILSLDQVPSPLLQPLRI